MLQVVGAISSIIGLALVLLQWGLPQLGVALNKTGGLVMTTLGAILLAVGIGISLSLLVQWIRKKSVHGKTGSSEPLFTLELREPPTLFRMDNQLFLEAKMTLRVSTPPLMLDEMQLKTSDITVDSPINLTLPIKLETNAQSFTATYRLPFYAPAFGVIRLGEEPGRLCLLVGGKEYFKDFVLPERID